MKLTPTVAALNTICPGWTESRENGLLCNPNLAGGIIDSEIVSGEWFVIFNDSRHTLGGYDSRDAAIEAFVISSTKSK